MTFILQFLVLSALFVAAAALGYLIGLREGAARATPPAPNREQGQPPALDIH